MTTRRILYDQLNTQLGKDVASAVGAALEARARFQRVLPILYAASFEDDFAALAAELGLTGPSAVQQATDLRSIFATAETHVSHAAVGELSRLDQGGS